MKDTFFSLDLKAKNLAAQYLGTEGQLLLVLMEMRRQRAFAALNYEGIFDYCERALKLSRAQAYYFKAVSEKSEEVPEMKKAILEGDLTLSQARRIAPVVTKENHKGWIERAQKLPQKELEKEVAAVNPRAHVREKIRPIAAQLSELKVGIDAKTEENLEALKDILSQKQGKPATLAEVVAWASEVAREKFDPVRRAVRSRAVSSGDSPEPKVGRQRVPASVKHPVVARDGMQCSYVSQDGRRCPSKRWLQMHHVLEVANGGLNIVDNLKLLCNAHHKLVHLSSG